jgi:uncharacterized coiled-coil DUF342 family protein
MAKPTDPTKREQEHIRKLRSESRNLRRRLKAAQEIADDVEPLRREVSRLRADSARYRIERNEARAEVAALRAELDELRSDWECESSDALELWQGLNPRSGSPFREADRPHDYPDWVRDYLATRNRAAR